jgi:hypothetical protein
MIGGQEYAVDCLGRRDHSWGGERDWSRLGRWEYLSGEIGPDFWFNAVKIKLVDLPVDINLGGIFDGEEVMGLSKVEINEATVEDGTRATGVEIDLTDEKGRRHQISGEMMATGNVWFGPSCLREGFARYTYGDRVGYGILEHGLAPRAMSRWVRLAISLTSAMPFQ